jgi:hypothetical protein
MHEAAPVGRPQLERHRRIGGRSEPEQRGHRRAPRRVGWAERGTAPEERGNRAVAGDGELRLASRAARLIRIRHQLARHACQPFLHRFQPRLHQRLIGGGERRRHHQHDDCRRE